MSQKEHLMCYSNPVAVLLAHARVPVCLKSRLNPGLLVLDGRLPDASEKEVSAVLFKMNACGLTKCA